MIARIALAALELIAAFIPVGLIALAFIGLHH